MKKLVIILCIGLTVVNPTFATDKEVILDTTQESIAQTETQKVTPKINLKAVLLDTDADFELDAKTQNREMTNIEIWEQDIHEALHGEVSKVDTTPLLSKYFKHDLERGPISQINFWNVYRGNLSNIWNNADYQNTLYTNDSMFSVLEGKFKNPKWGFRTLLIWTPSKAGHDFFNDVWGDQYITYNFTDSDKILVGYSRYDNGIEGNMSPHLLPFFARTQIAKTYGNARNLGVKVSGNHKYYNYSAGLFSSGRNFYDWFPGEEFVANLAVKPLAKANGKYGDMLLGASYDGGNADHGHLYNVGNIYLDYEYKRLKTTFEYGLADGSNGSVGFTPNKSEGFNATIAYRLTKKLQTLFRYDVFDPNKEKSNDIRTEYTVGLNYFLKGQALRLMLNYSMYTLENGSYGSRIYTGTQIIL